MQFRGQTHIIRVPLPSASVTRERVQALFEKAYFARFKVGCRRSAPMLVNLNTSVIGVRPAIDLSRLIDPAGRAKTLDEARREIGRSGMADAGTTRRSSHAKSCRSTRVIEARRSSSRWTPPPCSNPATAHVDADGNIISDIGEA